MRDIKIGVPGVLNVPQAGNPQKSYAFGNMSAGTPVHDGGVPGVPCRMLEHPAHLTENKVFHEKANEISIGTPGTLGTPDFVQKLNNGDKRWI